jgi:hypothetical protein
MSAQNTDQSPQSQPARLTDRTDEIWETSEAAKSLERMRANPRIKYIVVSVPEDACPACQNLTGTYPKDQVPRLPYEKCSHPLGCRAYYLPYLDEVFP